jgi:endonuclease/exonuclease/phosphatase family metal-dependent hydrolase
MFNRLVPLLICAYAFVWNPAAIATAQFTLPVMTFNVRYGTADDGPNAWELRKDLVVETIRSREPHVLGLQECLKFQADYIAAQMPEYDHFGAGREANGGGERMEIFYRPDMFVPLETGNFWLSETPDVPGSRSWKSANVRMATWARFRHVGSGRQFMYLNTHLDHRSEEARVEASKMLAAWAKNAPEGLPVVITADFNATAEQSLPWEILTEPLVDAWTIAAERAGPPVTWSAFRAPSDEVRRIDWILASPGVSVSVCETLTYNADGRYPSDHYPVFARLEMGVADSSDR